METELEYWNAQDVARLLALVESERRYYQELVTAVPIGLVVLGRDLNIRSSNREARALFGKRSGEPVRGTLEQFLPNSIVLKAKEVIESGDPQSNLQAFLADKPEKSVRVSIRQIRSWEDGELEALLTVEEVDAAGLLLSGHPATVDAALPAGELLDSLDAIVWALELPSKRFLFVNEKAQELLGYPSSRWLNTPTFWSDRIHPVDRDWVLQAYERSIAGWTRHSCEFRAISSYGKGVWLRESARLLQEPSGTKRYLIGFAVDVTQRHVLEGGFLHAQRVDAVSSLASRVAKQINNHAMVISGYTEEIANRLEPNHPVFEDVQEIIATAGKLRGLASQLSSFKGQPVRKVAAFDLVQWLKEIAPELHRRIGEGVTLDLTYFPAPLGVAAEPGQLQEVLTTVLNRARLNLAAGGKLTIECSPFPIDETLGRAENTLLPGVYALITIEDDGPTLDPPTRRALFEALVPTIDDREGLGPALSRAYGLVKLWGGDIFVDPGTPHGNVFQILLPRTGENFSAQEHTVATTVPQTPESSLTGPRPQTVLVFEEDSGIRTLIRKMLRRQSYNVIEAPTLELAQAVCIQNSETVDLLICGVFLELEQLRASCPNVRVLLLATEDQMVNLETRVPDAMVLLKPFTLGTLMARIKEVLAHARRM